MCDDWELSTHAVGCCLESRERKWLNTTEQCVTTRVITVVVYCLVSRQRRWLNTTEYMVCGD